MPRILRIIPSISTTHTSLLGLGQPGRGVWYRQVGRGHRQFGCPEITAFNDIIANLDVLLEGSKRIPMVMLGSNGFGSCNLLIHTWALYLGEITLGCTVTNLLIDGIHWGYMSTHWSNHHWSDHFQRDIQVGGGEGSWSWVGMVVEQWTKAFRSLLSYRGWNTTQLFRDYVISHYYKDPYKPTRIQWNVMSGFWALLTWVIWVGFGPWTMNEYGTFSIWIWLAIFSPGFRCFFNKKESVLYLIFLCGQ